MCSCSTLTDTMVSGCKQELACFRTGPGPRFERVTKWPPPSLKDKVNMFSLKAVLLLSLAQNKVAHGCSLKTKGMCVQWLSQSMGKADSLWLSFLWPALDLLSGRGLMGIQVPAHAYRGQRAACGSQFSLPNGGGSRVVRLGGKHHWLLSHFPSPLLSSQTMAWGSQGDKVVFWSYHKRREHFKY